MKIVPFCSRGEGPEQPEVIENNGRPVGTRTPDLYRVKSPSDLGTDEVE
jgi:hypothetical protein